MTDFNKLVFDSMKLYYLKYGGLLLLNVVKYKKMEFSNINIQKKNINNL